MRTSTSALWILIASAHCVSAQSYQDACAPFRAQAGGDAACLLITFIQEVGRADQMPDALSALQTYRRTRDAKSGSALIDVYSTRERIYRTATGRFGSFATTAKSQSVREAAVTANRAFVQLAEVEALMRQQIVDAMAGKVVLTGAARDLDAASKKGDEAVTLLVLSAGNIQGALLTGSSRNDGIFDTMTLTKAQRADVLRQLRVTFPGLKPEGDVSPLRLGPQLLLRMLADAEYLSGPSR